MTSSLIQKLLAAKQQKYKGFRLEPDEVGFNDGIERAIQIIRQHKAEQPQDVVERVAIAIWNAAPFVVKWEDVPEAKRIIIRGEARAAIAAMNMGAVALANLGEPLGRESADGDELASKAPELDGNAGSIPASSATTQFSTEAVKSGQSVTAKFVARSEISVVDGREVFMIVEKWASFHGIRNLTDKANSNLVNQLKKYLRTTEPVSVKDYERAIRDELIFHFQDTAGLNGSMITYLALACSKAGRHVD